MKQILLAYSLPKETVTALMMLYKNTKVKVRSLDGDRDYFDIEVGVLPGDSLAPYLSIIARYKGLKRERRKKKKKERMRGS